MLRLCQWEGLLDWCKAEEHFCCWFRWNQCQENSSQCWTNTSSILLDYFWGNSSIFLGVFKVFFYHLERYNSQYDIVFIFIFFPRTMFTGQIGHQRPFVRSTSSLGKNTHNWPLVWDHQWTLKYIMNKDSCTVSRLANIFVNLIIMKFFCRLYNWFLPLYRFEKWNLVFPYRSQQVWTL